MLIFGWISDNYLFVVAKEVVETFQQTLDCHPRAVVVHIYEVEWLICKRACSIYTVALVKRHQGRQRENSEERRIKVRLRAQTDTYRQT